MGKVVVFDFDGTIADIMKVIPQLVTSVSSQLGIPPITDQQIEKYRGYTIAQGMKENLIPVYKIPRAVTLARTEMRAIRSQIELVPGMDNLVRELREDPTVEALYVLTSNSRENVEEFLRKYKIFSSFDDIICGLTLFNKPKKLKALIKRGGYKSENVAIIGDEVRDIEAGKKNRTKTIAVTWGINSVARLQLTKPDFTVDSVEELRRVLE